MKNIVISLVFILGLSVPVFAEEPKEVFVYYLCKGVMVNGEVTPTECIELGTEPVGEETEKQGT